MPTRMLIDTTNTSTGSSSSSQFRLPLESIGTYSFTIDWGDGSSDDTITVYNQAEVTHTYSVSGQYEISITGTLVGWRFNNSGDKLKLVESREFHSGFRLGNSGEYYFGCSNHALFANGLNTSGTTGFSSAWYNNSLTSFPAIDLSNGTDFTRAWYNNSLTSFPAINLSNGTDFTRAWEDNNLTSFPVIDLSNGTNFTRAWRLNSLTSFPALDLSNGTNFFAAWENNNLTSFPVIDLSNGTNFGSAWRGNSLTSFPAIDLSNGTDFSVAWFQNNLTSFPAIDMPLGTDFSFAWEDNNLTSFPVIDLSNGTNFARAWRLNTLDTYHYNNLLVNLAANNSNTAVDFSGGSSKHGECGTLARKYLVDHLGWIVTDGGVNVGYVEPGRPRILSSYQIGGVG